MKFSIVTCTWNSEPYLADSIASVLRQDHSAIEFIFVDGGSTDGTLERIARVPVPYVLLRNVRGGVSHAMNAGLEAATGEIVAHLHADDYYAHDRVLSRVACLFSKESTQWLFGRCLQRKGDTVAPENHAIPRYSFQRLLKGNFIPHPSTFVRRTMFQRAGHFDETLRYAMDYDMWLRLGRIAPAVQVDEHFAVFRTHEASLSSANPFATFEEDFKVRMRYISNAPWAAAYHWAHYRVRRRRLVRRSAAARIAG